MFWQSKKGGIEVVKFYREDKGVKILRQMWAVGLMERDNVKKLLLQRQGAQSK